MSTLSKRSFAGGELDPALHYRVDLSKYTTGVKTLRNLYIERHGGATNRPGMQFVSEIKDSTATVILHPFIFNVDQAYILEFGDLYLRVISDGAHLKEAAVTITGATAADPVVVTTGTHGYTDGDEVYITGVLGMTELNNRNFKVSNKTATTFELQGMDSVDIDGTGYTAYSSAGTSNKIYEVAHGYIEADLLDLDFVQSADVLTIVHPDYPPQELSRVSELSWVFSDLIIAPGILGPRGYGTVGVAGTDSPKYKVTSVAEQTLEESLPQREVVKALAGITTGSPAIFATSAPHGYATGDIIFLQFGKNDILTKPIYGEINTGAGGGPHTITVTSVTQFHIGFNTTGATAAAGDSFIERDVVIIHLAGTGTSAGPHVISWTAVDGAQEYNVYRAENEIYGLLGVSGGVTFEDIGQSVDLSSTPPIDVNPFDSNDLTITNITKANPAVVTYAIDSSDPGTLDEEYANDDIIYISAVAGMTEINNLTYIVQGLNTTTKTFNLQDSDGVNLDSTGYTTYASGGNIAQQGNYPSAVTYFQQRLVLGNSDNDPEKIWTSRTGKFKNFTIRSPIQSDDAITFTMAGRQVNSIKHLLDVGRLIVFTISGEWTVGGDDSDILRPTSINPKQHSYNGSSTLSPLVINNNALYIQARGSYIRDLGYDVQIDGYRGNDLTVFSSHLFEDFTIIDWAYQQIPNSIVWAVRSDGVLLSLTYVREQEIFAWAKHDFEGGTVERVAVIPEGSEDSIYVTVKRTIDGRVTRYVERMYSRNIVDIIDSKFMDSYLSFDGRNTAATTMTLSGGSTWTYLENLTLTSSVAYFVAGDVGNGIHITDAAGDVVRCTINGFTSTTIVTVKAHKTVPADLRSAATAVWSKAVDTVSGLWHLEGESVSVFADRFVVGNPNNDSYDTLTVASGSVTLDKPYTVIHVGLPYTSDLETLNIDTPEGETITDKKMLISQLTIGVKESRGVFVGNEAPDETVNFLDGLTEVKVRNIEDYDDPVALVSGVMNINIRPEWNSNGRIFIRQTDPVPLTILSIHPAGFFPFKG